MSTLENIIGNYNGIREEDFTHRRSFLNPNQTTRGSWYNKSRFGI